MTNKRAYADKGGEKGRFLAALRGTAVRAYLTGGPVFGLVVIALFAAGHALSAIANLLSPARRSAARRDGAGSLARL